MFTRITIIIMLKLQNSYSLGRQEFAIRANRGIPKSLADSSKKVKRDDTICHQKGGVLHIWKDKREVRMISTVYNGTIGEVANKFGERIKKPRP
jgi:hypothetical protein